MQVHILRRLYLRPPLHTRSLCSSLPRFYGEEVVSQVPAETNDQRAEARPEPQNDFTSFLSQFRETAPAPVERAHIHSVLNGLKLVPRRSPANFDNTQVPYIARPPFVPLPPRPKSPGYPALWLTLAQCGRYLPTLYGRLWRVMAHQSHSNPKAHLYLVKRMFFSNEEHAQAFFVAVTKYMEQYQHHGHLSRLGTEVFYATNTHSAFVHQRLGKVEWSPRYDEPGITLLDVRIAIRIEELWERYLGRGEAILPPPGTPDPGRQVLSVMGFGLAALGKKTPNPLRAKHRLKSLSSPGIGEES